MGNEAGTIILVFPLKLEYMAYNYKVEGLDRDESATDAIQLEIFGRAATPVDEAMHAGIAEFHTAESKIIKRLQKRDATSCRPRRQPYTEVQNGIPLTNTHKHV